MQLDKRIKSIDSIRSFNTDNDDCLGKFGYFTNYVTNFDDLNSIRKGICVFKDGERFPFYCGDQKSHYCDDQKFQFFIPESELLPKEKKFRPYTLEEFCDKFHFGYGIILRPKDLRSMELHVVYNGYKILTASNKTEFYLGRAIFTLSELFEGYERFENGQWGPFGVEVEE